MRRQNGQNDSGARFLEVMRRGQELRAQRNGKATPWWVPEATV